MSKKKTKNIESGLAVKSTAKLNEEIKAILEAEPPEPDEATFARMMKEHTIHGIPHDEYVENIRKEKAKRNEDTKEP